MRAMTTMLVQATCLATARHARTASDNVTYSLSWTRLAGAEKCVAGGTLARAVETRLGRPAWAATSLADIQIEGQVEPRTDRPGWRVRIVLSDPKGAVLGQREIASDEASCDALEEPLVLMLALII